MSSTALTANTPKHEGAAGGDAEVVEMLVVKFWSRFGRLPTVTHREPLEASKH